MSLLDDALFAAASDATATVIAYWDTGCHNLVANPAFERRMGRTAQEVLGTHIREVIGPKQYDLRRPYLDGVLSGTPQAFERVYNAEGGIVHHVRVEYVPDSIEGDVIGFASMAIDLEPVTTELSDADVATRLRFALHSVIAGLRAIHHRLGLS